MKPNLGVFSNNFRWKIRLNGKMKLNAIWVFSSVFFFEHFFWENGEDNCGIIEESKAKDKCGLRWDGDENDE